MSPPDLVTELRRAPPIPPAELRERVALLAATAPTEPPRRRRWVLAAVGALAVALAATAAIVSMRGGDRTAETGATAGASADAPTVTRATRAAQPKAFERDAVPALPPPTLGAD